MATKTRSLQVYDELATWYDRQGQAKLRDWFLVLAADTALALGQPDQAERLRQRLLHVNPHHLLRPFASFAEALQSPDVKGYVADLRRNYPPETAEQLLQSTLKKHAPETRAVSPSTRTGDVSEEERELKVYRVRETPEDATPVAEDVPTKDLRRPPPRQEPAALPPARMPQPVAWTRPPTPVLQRPAAAPKPAPDSVDDEGPTGLGFWVSSLLFAATLLLGIGLLGYALARPFLSL